MSDGFHESEVVLTSEFSRRTIASIQDEQIDKVRIESSYLLAGRDASLGSSPICFSFFLRRQVDGMRLPDRSFVSL